ncbi:MAG: RimK family alpha-L-glutamate ligase [Burkholderiales bacterium]|nr:RimK family alpha-L-glutamate ligase [Burkholderiales bacterium]
MVPEAPRVLIATDDAGWHGRRLDAALVARGLRPVTASLRDCRIDLARPSGLLIPGFADAPDGLPHAVFVRGISGGSLEQITLRLDVLHALQALGVPVFNHGRAIERSVDKAMTSLLLHRAGIPTPPTWACESREQAQAVVDAETVAGYGLVVKPLFGSQGIGVQRVVDRQLPAPEALRHAYYLQRFVDTSAAGWHDFRVFVIGRAVVAAMIRRGSDWISNVAQGARCEAVPAAGQLARLAVDAAAALEMDYAGVDLICGRDGQLMVVEVNGIPAWRGLQSVCGFDVAQRLVDDLLPMAA